LTSTSRKEEDIQQQVLVQNGVQKHLTDQTDGFTQGPAWLVSMKS
jgi:hypothetical protein